MFPDYGSEALLSQDVPVDMLLELMEGEMNGGGRGRHEQYSADSLFGLL